jgi:nitrogen fixation protein NifU and related proteins
MSELQDLYQEVILDHNRRPRNFQILEDANRKAEGYNPLCGDQITVYVHLENDVIKDVSFQGTGCAISKASASLMTTSLKGKTRAEAESLFGRFHQMVTGTGDRSDDPAELGKLAVFAGVREFPVRVKCATLSWHTLRAALRGAEEKVTTE